MHDTTNVSKFIMRLLVGLILVISAVTLIQPIPPNSTDISKKPIKDPGSQGTFTPSYIPHDPISIYTNAGFTSQGFPGNGTAEDPYIIEGYDITTGGDCISIRDTDTYFVIRNCLLTGGLGYIYDGIALIRVNNGEIRNNTIYGKDCGVSLEASSNNIIVKNNISGNDNFGEGVVIDSSSHYNTVTTNFLSGNTRGVEIYGNNNSIYLNQFAYNIDVSAWDSGTDNHWNTTGMGNYWSDYDGNDVYHIQGHAESIDYHPFFYPPDATPGQVDMQYWFYVLGGGVLIFMVVFIYLHRQETDPTYGMSRRQKERYKILKKSEMKDLKSPVSKYVARKGKVEIEVLCKKHRVEKGVIIKVGRSIPDVLVTQDESMLISVDALQSWWEEKQEAIVFDINDLESEWSSLEQTELKKKMPALWEVLFGDES